MVVQVDEEDEPTGFSTNSSMVTLWPPNKDEGDADNDDLEWDNADLMGRRKVTFSYKRWMREKRRLKVTFLKFTRATDKSVHINGEVCTHYPAVFIFIFT